jgi:hypothetical protein
MARRRRVVGKRGGGYYIDYITPTKRRGVAKIAAASILDLPPRQTDALLQIALKRWKGKHRGYRVTDVYYSTSRPSWATKRPRKPRSVPDVRYPKAKKRLIERLLGTFVVVRAH